MARGPRRTPRDDEARFLASYDAGKFERPSVAVDVALLSVADGLGAAQEQVSAGPQGEVP